MTAQWRSNPQIDAEKTDEKREKRDERDTTTALEVLKIASAMLTHAATAPPTARQLADYAETLWQWTTTDTWPSR